MQDSKFRATGSRKLNIAVWIVQVLLGLDFAFAGAMKSLAPIEQLAEQMVWPGALPALLVRFIGVSEFLGGLGLLLPSPTRIKPVLTPLAALGLLIIMVLAAIFHVARSEWGVLPFNVVLGGMAAFVAWGRFKKVPITPR